MIKVLRVILLLAVIAVTGVVLKGVLKNVSYFAKNDLKSFLNNQFSRTRFKELPNPYLPQAKEELLVSNGIYIPTGGKSTQGIKDWRKIQYWIKDGKDFSYLDIDLVWFYDQKDAEAFYLSEKETRMLETPHQAYSQKESGLFGYYFSKPVSKRINLQNIESDYPGYASFVLIFKENMFIGINELTSLERSPYKLDVLKKIGASR